MRIKTEIQKKLSVKLRKEVVNRKFVQRMKQKSAKNKRWGNHRSLVARKKKKKLTKKVNFYLLNLLRILA